MQKQLLRTNPLRMTRHRNRWCCQLSHLGGPPPNPNLGSLLQKPGRPNPVPAVFGEGVEKVVSNIPFFINITEEGKRK